ncbi:Di-trans-poly-cis-decaprenylcistransferase [Atractiella rhizophila]|nr:Di-trans-poly-cis-decaprenylcistransferase [Atractiella rhizophila]
MSFPLGIFKYAPASIQPWMRSTLVQALKLGPLPKHLAFIMDGNRRYARSMGEDVIEGHEFGFLALKKLLEFLLHLDVEVVTVYAFSIENFGRPQREVDKLMDMAKKRLVEMCQHGFLLDRYSVRIRILGRLDLLPDDVRRSCMKAQELTSKNTGRTLNFLFPYTSRDEIAASIRNVSRQCVEGEMDISEISPETLEQNLYTYPSPPPDILIRTSAVNRLSDYMLWQVSPLSPTSVPRSYGFPSMYMELIDLDELDRQANEGTKLYFIPPSWPEITVVDLLPIILGWQAEEMMKNCKKWLIT